MFTWVFKEPSSHPQRKHIKKESQSYFNTCRLTSVIETIAAMLARFKKEAFLAPNLSINYPIAYDPAISPTPKRDMATKAFEVNCDLLKSASDVVFLSSNVIAGINKPDQKEIEIRNQRIQKINN